MIGTIKKRLMSAQPMQLINHGLNLCYCGSLLAIGYRVSFANNLVMLLAVAIGLRLINQHLLNRLQLLGRVRYLLIAIEIAVLLLLGRSVATTWSSTSFLFYTALLVLNYPARFAIPLVYLGYSLYLWLLTQTVSTIEEYFLSLLNFSIIPLVSLLAVRALIDQRTQILQLNQRLQSQAKLTAEMSRLRERNALAEAMHDTIGHTLTSSIVSLEGVALLLEKRPSEAVSLLDSVRQQLQESLGDLRQTVRSLKTDTLAEQTNLSESLGLLAERIRRQTATAIILEDRLSITLLPIQEYVLYSVAREGITNALKHSQASQVQILLDNLSDHQVRLSIVDNGQGTARVEAGFGLSHLQQKVEALGGTFSITAHMHQGFRLEVILPLARETTSAPYAAAMKKEASP
jgi:signal transduction histidine kinase